jgi:stress response protein YsnF
MKHEAIGASYPIAKEESESVGLNEIRIDVQKARYLSDEVRSLLVKKYVEYAKKIDWRKPMM